MLAKLPPEHVELAQGSDETEALRQAYLEAGIVGIASSNVAAHIAAATTAEVDIVVSWNFKHIAKIAGYEGVNTLRGFRSSRIYSPKEVVEP